VSSKPRRRRCSFLFSFRSMLSTGSFWCVMGSSTWPVCCSRFSGRPTGDRDSSITTGKVKYQQSGLGARSRLIFNAIPCLRAKSSARKFARLKLLLLFVSIESTYQTLGQCFICYASTSIFVKNTLPRVVFSTLYLHFRKKHSLSCLICYAKLNFSLTDWTFGLRLKDLEMFGDSIAFYPVWFDCIASGACFTPHSIRLDV